MSEKRTGQSKRFGPGPSDTFRVVVVDKHSLIRECMKDQIVKNKGFVVCGEASEGAQALKVIAQEKPDVAVIDLDIRGMSGLDLIKHIKRRWPRIPLLVSSISHDEEYAERAFRTGAKGYITKDESIEFFMSALSRVVHGRVYLSPKLSESKNKP